MTVPVHARGLEDPQNLVIHDGRARQVVRLARLVECDDGHSEVIEQQREQLARQGRGRR